MRRIAIERKSGVSRSNFTRDHLERGGVPVILTDAMDAWQARAKWTFDWLKERFGRDHATAQTGLFSGVSKLTTLGAYIDHLDAPDSLPGFWVNQTDSRPLRVAPPAAASPPYLLGWHAFRRHPELYDDVAPLPASIPDWTAALDATLRSQIEAESGRDYWSLYLGPVGSLSQLHQDFWHTHAYLAQVQGRKRALLFAPGDSAFLYDGEVDPEKPDLDRFPEYERATAYECVLEPGELLFIPAAWWHHVRGVSATITLSHNFFNGSNADRHLKHLSAELRIQVAQALAAR